MPWEPEEEVQEALAVFVDALNNLDRASLEGCFTERATNFKPWGGPRRQQFWAEQFDQLRATRPGPPYQHVRPLDLEIEAWGDVAIATFHLDHGPERIGRRTLVLRRMPDGWKIAHLHASNLPRAEPPAGSRGR